ncbi:glutamate carboxypeptidase 2-like [Acanthaster planci]|uniref:Glutamate carboxypeptidase 2-like n=1 Tax=Acanthaster planci TaxID=133434 RepID=A0A8B7YD99_ACAPL|nr:glutamate carboxypeptidase 2-like [Acanthaster planci]
MEEEKQNRKTSKWPRPMFWIITVALAVAGIGLGVIIGHFTAPRNAECTVPTPDPNTDTPPVNVIERINAENIEENLRYFTKVPHIAGSPAERSNAEYMRDTWEEQGLDSARLVPYDVLLSYPDDNIPNKVSILDDGNEIFHSRLEEAMLRPGDDHPDVVPPFNAYSYQGEPEGDLVYANYARVEDFEYLEKNHPDLNLTGTIIIARYGKIFRGNKVMLIYSKVLRNCFFKTRCPAFAFRIDDEDTALPKIPVHPIGYGDAQLLLGNMTGVEVIESWRGHLPVTYRIGPGFSNPQRLVPDYEFS